MMRAILAIAHLTWLEARRRRVVLAALICGLGFQVVFAALLYMTPMGGDPVQDLLTTIRLQAFSLLGLYAVNFLVAAFAVMLPVDTLSGEIASGVMQTLAAKPVRRMDILLGKWLVYWVMLAGYILLMTLGVVGIMWLLRGFTQGNLPAAMGLMLLEASVLLSITFAGGARLSTVTNGIVAFAFFALAFIGGWIEQIGVMVGSPASRYIGTAISLVVPTDALWRLAMYVLQPVAIAQRQLGPFSSGSVPSLAMVWWAVAYTLGVFALAARWFQRRPL
jgi:ABC-type transport system involved in multi-copper enzyme maturation permease subunit